MYFSVMHATWALYLTLQIEQQITQTAKGTKLNGINLFILQINICSDLFLSTLKLS